MPLSRLNVNQNSSELYEFGIKRRLENFVYCPRDAVVTRPDVYTVSNPLARADSSDRINISQLQCVVCCVCVCVCDEDHYTILDLHMSSDCRYIVVRHATVSVIRAIDVSFERLVSLIENTTYCV